MNDKDNRTTKRIIGDNAEEAVVRMMLNDGYSLLCRNFEIHNVGELDCVFMKDRDVFIVEVRTRRNLGNYPSSSETVDFRKRRKIEMTAQYLISRYNLYDRNIVFLVAQVTHDASGMFKNIELIPF
ncbi:MAG: YraN family protein [Saccharofermentans sp.]|nr:YraN family protein [Saccharofermentans sp.]